MFTMHNLKEIKGQYKHIFKKFLNIGLQLVMCFSWSEKAYRPSNQSGVGSGPGQWLEVVGDGYGDE